MKASFVIATYNRVEDLERCIDSILKQEDCAFEILIMDDASTDGTPRFVKEKYGERVQLIERAENCGSIRNRNEGAKLARGDILFMLDDDTEIPGTHTISEALREFEDPRVGALAIPYIQQGKLRKSSPSDDVEYAVASYVGCASAVRRDLFLSLGGYDVFFYHQVEEDDFCLRMLDAGYFCKIARVTEPMLHHESPIRNFRRLDYVRMRNSLLYVWKSSPVLYLVPNLIVTTYHGLGFICKQRRFIGSIKGLFGGYGALLQSICGRGSVRRPVRIPVYKASLRMRQKPRPIREIAHVLPGGKKE